MRAVGAHFPFEDAKLSQACTCIIDYIMNQKWIAEAQRSTTSVVWPMVQRKTK